MPKVDMLIKLLDYRSIVTHEITHHILLNYQDNFASEDSINSIVHSIEPCRFGVLSFKHYSKTKGALIPRIINKEFNPDETAGFMFGY